MGGYLIKQGDKELWAGAHSRHGTERYGSNSNPISSITKCGGTSVRGLGNTLCQSLRRLRGGNRDTRVGLSLAPASIRSTISSMNCSSTDAKVQCRKLNHKRLFSLFQRRLWGRFRKGRFEAPISGNPLFREPLAGGCPRLNGSTSSSQARRLQSDGYWQTTCRLAGRAVTTAMSHQPHIRRLMATDDQT